MSNIIRFESGVSLKMRQAIADRAGMSIDEIINIGREIATAEQQTEFAKSLPVNSDNMNVTPNTSLYGSANEIMAIANNLNLTLHSAITQHSQTINQVIYNLISERDKLIKLLSQERMIINSLPIMVKVVDKSMKVISVNRVMLETFQTAPRDTCDINDCWMCKNDSKEKCMIQEVFETGNTIQKMVKCNDIWYLISMYPVTDIECNIDKVIVTIINRNVLTDILKENGWIEPV